MTDYEKLWNEITEIVSEQLETPKQEHEKTAEELKELWQVSQRRTNEIVRSLVERGLLSSRKVRSRNGVRVVVYFPNEKDPQ